MVERRNLRIWGFTAVGAVGAWAIIRVSWRMFVNPAPSAEFGNLASKGFGDPAWIWAMTAAAGVAIVWGIVFWVFGFRAADEFVQQGRRVAWYWGARLGLAASVPAAIFIGSGGLSWIWPAVSWNRELGEAFFRGYALVPIMQFGGYMAVRAWWWASKR